MTLPPTSTDRTLAIYLTLAQYPILAAQIRIHMRREIFRRGVITSQAFETEVREKAIRSQALEGLHNPFTEEPADVWETRMMRVRDHLTDFYFAYNLPYDLFEQIIREVLNERGAQDKDLLVSFNPELAPQNMLFEQAFAIEKLPPEERAQADARLREIKVVLIRTLISDQLAYVNIAKEWFTISDLSGIRQRKIGHGKIGGKSAGMLLAARILIEADDELRTCLRIPESYFIGADTLYDFMRINDLMHWMDQKYKTEEHIRAEYPLVKEDFLNGEFPADILVSIRGILDHIGQQPVIVRSSSLLEDNFGYSFAGKYESHFCPNQSTPEENLLALTKAIKHIYASTLNPDALLYRRAKSLADYDERMAILIQIVQGERQGRYYYPHAAGVAFSRNLYRWSPKIRREDGFLRIVWGLGTRAVDRMGNDYPRLVALSHPLLHPENSPIDIQRYSQKYVDVIDLEANDFKTLPIHFVLNRRYPILRYLAQVDQGGYLTPIRSMVTEGGAKGLVLTFDELFRRTPLADRMRKMLQLLERHYKGPVDTEFTVEVAHPLSLNPEVFITLLQCRPQSRLKESEARLPQSLSEEDIVFSTPRMAPEGEINNIRYVLFVTPEGYYSLTTPSARSDLVRAISLLNSILTKENFILIGPGRWGTSNPDLGIHVGFGDIYNTRALIELSGQGIGSAPEASFGTHFFQDLLESNIYPLAIYLDDEGVVFKRDFFYDTPNRLSSFLPPGNRFGACADFNQDVDCLRVIAVEDYRPGCYLKLVMDDEEGRAVAFLNK